MPPGQNKPATIRTESDRAAPARKDMRMQRNSLDMEWFLLNPDKGHSWLSRLNRKPKEK